MTSSVTKGCESKSSDRLNQVMEAAGLAPSTVQVRETISPATTGDDGPRILRDRGFTVGGMKSKKNKE